MQPESTAPRSTPAGTAGVGARVQSLDIFRGLVIVLMVFSNASTRMGLPWWMEHVYLTEGQQARIAGRVIFLTWPDMIFPAFLFIMGVAIPVAFDRKLEQGQLRACLAGILKRSFLLLWVGAVLYGWSLGETVGGVSLALWTVLGFVALAAMRLDWTEPLRRLTGKGYWGRIVAAAGAAYFVLATFLYEAADGSRFFGSSRFRVSILGFLGMSYLVASLVWIATRNRRLLRVAFYLLGFVFWLHLRQDGALLRLWFGPVIRFLRLPNAYVYNGMITLAGTFVGDLFLRRNQTGSVVARHPGTLMLAAGVLFVLASAVIRHPSLAMFNEILMRKMLFCTGASLLAFLAVFKLEQHLGHHRRFGRLAFPLAETGRNPMFAYGLQFALGALLALAVRNEAWVQAPLGYTVFGVKGWAGLIVATAPFTAAVVALTCLANRYRLYLKM